jgi:hypothetical protein
MAVKLASDFVSLTPQKETPETPQKAKPQAYVCKDRHTIGFASFQLLNLNAAVDFMVDKESVGGAYRDLGTISALLLTMVSLSSIDHIGENTPFGVSEETAGYIFSSFAYLAAGHFLVCSILSAFITVFVNVLLTDDEAVHFVKRSGTIFRVSIFALVVGLISYLLLITWQVFTIIPLSMGMFIVGPMLFLYKVATTALLDGIRTMYDIKAHRDEGAARAAEKPAVKELL